jgi:hypothetical protein
MSLRRCLPVHIRPVSCAHEQRGHGSTCIMHRVGRLSIGVVKQKALVQDRVPQFEAH